MKALIQLVVSLIVMLHAAALQRHAAGHAESQHGPTATQRNVAPRSNQGHIPPAPSMKSPRAGSAERWPGGQVNSTPHVNHDRWYGQDDASDARYRLSSPHIVGAIPHLGPNYRYSIVRVDRSQRRFWIPGGFYYEVAAWDWPWFTDWCWDCGDDFVLYGDPYHPGWDLLYNVHTGIYVHILYRGE